MGLSRNKLIRLFIANLSNCVIHRILECAIEDSANAAGCIIDAIRYAKIALDRNIGGPVYSASSYLMKHPPKRFSDDEAKENCEKFINGEIDW